MDEVDCEAIYGGLELRPLVKIGLASPPIIRAAPISDELLQLHQRRPLLPSDASLFFRPARQVKPPFEIRKSFIRCVISEGNDGGAGGGLSGRQHNSAGGGG